MTLYVESYELPRQNKNPMDASMFRLELVFKRCDEDSRVRIWSTDNVRLSVRRSRRRSAGPSAEEKEGQTDGKTDREIIICIECIL